MRIVRSTLVALLILHRLLAAQHGGGASAGPARMAPAEAAQFDFLIGQWQLTVEPKVSGLAAKIHGAPKLLGSWKAWKALDGFGIEDELRIFDRSGNPTSLTHSIRIYDATARRWSNSWVDVYRARFSSSTSEWRGSEMVSSGSGVDQEGTAYLSRTRFFDITRDGFKMQQDRSTDDGKTWTEGLLKITAKRTAETTAPR